MVFWELSSWAEEEEEAARHHRLVGGPEGKWKTDRQTGQRQPDGPTQQRVHQSLLPGQVSWGWAAGGRRWGRGLWGAAGRGVVWSDAGEDRCGRPAAADDDGGGADDADVDVDWEDDYVDADFGGQGWSIPNEAPPLLLS